MAENEISNALLTTLNVPLATFLTVDFSMIPALNKAKRTTHFRRESNVIIRLNNLSNEQWLFLDYKN
jgi:hypothetical protein